MEEIQENLAKAITNVPGIKEQKIKIKTLKKWKN